MHRSFNLFTETETVYMFSQFIFTPKFVCQYAELNVPNSGIEVELIPGLNSQNR